MDEFELEIASIARALTDKHPELDPLTLGFRGLAKRIREIGAGTPRALDDPDWIEAVQRTWHGMFLERQGTGA